MEHTQNVEQQITEAWREYSACCLDHQPERAEALMRRIDALLDCIPRQRT